MSKYPPVLIFAYKRPVLCGRLLDSLEGNIDSSMIDLHVFIDGPRCEEEIPLINSTALLFSNVRWAKSIKINRFAHNKGLAASVISGVSSALQSHGSVIVLEDDLVLSRYFLVFMKEAICRYRESKDVYAISGYNHTVEKMPIPKHYTYPIYLASRPSTWGWATWADKWQGVNWGRAYAREAMANRESMAKLRKAGPDLPRMLKRQAEGEIDSWGIMWSLHLAKQGGLAVYPTQSYVDNTGFGEDGTHCNKGAWLQPHKRLNDSVPESIPLLSQMDHTIARRFVAVNKRRMHIAVYRRLQRVVLRILRLRTRESLNE